MRATPPACLRFIHLTLFLLAATDLASAGSKGETTAPPPADAAESVLFDTPPAVETAALYTQTLQEAPANVTVITEREIRRYGYRTLSEAISNVRGFFISNDGALDYAGVRGFSLPGDYNTRILVLVNGHYLTDNIYGAMYLFGQDFGLDMDLVQRIEVIRGASSSLYGSNGVFATINIFTRAPAESPRGYVSTELGTFGEKKAIVSTSHYLGHGANLLMSASGFHTAGRTLRHPENPSLLAPHTGSFRGYHTFGQFTWQNWSITANFSDYFSPVPIGWYGSDFGDPGTRNRNAHNFIEAVWTTPLRGNAEMRWRLAYDQFRYDGHYMQTMDGATVDNWDWAKGDWLSTKVSVLKPLGRWGRLTLGTGMSADLRTRQGNEDIAPERVVYLDANNRNASVGLFAQQEFTLTPRWTLFAGLRADDTRFDRLFLSPKLAAVWKRTASTTFKFAAGRAFRNPSTFERFWESNPLLRAETMTILEGTAERRLARGITLVATGFHYRLRGLIEGVLVREGILQYQNVSASHANGFESELQGPITSWLETSASYSWHRARYNRNSSELPNSPAHIVQVRAAVPRIAGKLALSGALRRLSSRASPYDFRVGAATLADLTATTTRLHPSFDVQFGVRNLAGARYADPLSREHDMQVMPRAGRTFFVKLIWRHGE